MQTPWWCGSSTGYRAVAWRRSVRSSLSSQRRRRGSSRSPTASTPRSHPRLPSSGSSPTWPTRSRSMPVSGSDRRSWSRDDRADGWEARRPTATGQNRDVSSSSLTRRRCFARPPRNCERERPCPRCVADSTGPGLRRRAAVSGARPPCSNYCVLPRRSGGSLIRCAGTMVSSAPWSCHGSTRPPASPCVCWPLASNRSSPQSSSSLCSECCRTGPLQTRARQGAKDPPVTS